MYFECYNFCTVIPLDKCGDVTQSSRQAYERKMERRDRRREIQRDRNREREAKTETDRRIWMKHSLFMYVGTDIVTLELTH